MKKRSVELAFKTLVILIIVLIVLALIISYYFLIYSRNNIFMRNIMENVQKQTNTTAEAIKNI